MLKRTDFFDSSQWVADEPQNWTNRGVTIEVARDAHLALGPPDASGHDEVCPGPGRAWRLLSDCGLQIVLIQAMQNADGEEELLLTRLVAPFRAEAVHALQHLPFESRILSADDTCELSSGWELSRLDDNGQRFVVGCFPRKSSADCVASFLGAGGHKQTYGVRLVEPRPLMVSDTGEWEVWRGDEAGNSFLVTRHFTHHHAQMQLEALEAEPRHKQVYWVAHRDGGEVRQRAVGESASSGADVISSAWLHK